jgi:hypothetical protein
MAASLSTRLEAAGALLVHLGAGRAAVNGHKQQLLHGEKGQAGRAAA